MGKSIKVNQNKRGRPATGRNPVSAVRLPLPLAADIDAWAARSSVDSRSDAIRKLVEIGLASTRSKRKASEMAGSEIDRMTDSSATDDEQQVRKARLLKGPKEFREIRRDHPQGKRK